MARRLRVRCKKVMENGNRCQAPAYMNRLCKRHHPSEGVSRHLKIAGAEKEEGKQVYRQEFDPALAAMYIQKVREGYSQSRVCQMEGMPDRKLVWRWKHENPAFDRELEKARVAVSDDLVEEMVEIADDTRYETHRARLMVEARKTAAQMLNPRRYGNQMNVSHDVRGNLAKKLMEARERVAKGRVIEHEPGE